MEHTPRPGRPRDLAVDHAILDAAAARMSRYGYERMTIDDVARDAGVTRPTVYRRWASKDALAVAAIETMITVTEHEPTGDTRQDLFDQAEQMFTRWSGNRFLGLVGTAIAERDGHRSLYDLLQERLIQPRRTALRAILERGIADGTVRPDTDIDAIVSMFVGSFYAVGIAEQWSQLTDWPERLTELIMRLISAHNG
ncbi:TetR/AcrR family transcriptional regulator [Paeniglutamicibacter sp. MACA_103]|uniref:TetR/AcrR family transcriptional regulator n=1 Tax=Paeniglutamicibacter sp. MACA_103 TaxID=3377337 RepID=UPI0038936004